MAKELNSQREIDEQALCEIEARCLLENTKTSELQQAAARKKAQAGLDENDTGEAQ